MWLWAPMCRRLLLCLLITLPSWPLCSPCPQDCTCNPPQLTQIFCIQRRSSSMPLNLPAFTRHLYVFQNGISSLHQQDFHSLTKLELLDLSQNQLTEIPDQVFGSLTSLHNLDLSANGITHISKESFAGLVNLERLYLHSNKIQHIHPDAFKNLEHLLELKLQGNEIDVLPALHLPRLLLLDLSFNTIPAPGPADLQTPHLESLKLAGLGLTTLDEGLMRSLGNLHDLDVSQNQLAGLPPALRSAKGLIRLNLASNPLVLLKQEDFKNLVALQELDLSNLNLQGFPAGFFQMFPRLHQITAAENPFNCLCPLAWFPSWLKERNVELGRMEETRCHFPPLNAGKVLAELEHKDFGCPATTTEQSDALIVSSSTHDPPVPTTALLTTHAFPLPPVLPSEEPSAETNSDLKSELTVPPRSREEHRETMCPSNICLNGGTCIFDQLGQVDCLCPPGTSGAYCENQDESQPLPPDYADATVAVLDGISSHHVSSTSISLDLHRYIESRPHIRGIRLTYRNLSGPDRRPLQLNVPSSYPEYTLRGLLPNCTYSVCASPLGEPVDAVSSCMEARTAGNLQLSHEPSMNRSEPSPTLVPILIAVAVVMAVAIIAVVVVVLRRRRAKSPADMDLGEPEPFELEGVKACMENGLTPHKQHPEIIMPCPAVSQNGMEYEVPLIQEQFTANNNTDGRMPPYIKMQKCAAQTSGP